MASIYGPLLNYFYDHVDDYTRMDLDFAADGNLRELSGEEAWEAIENFAQGQKEWDNPPNIISEQEVANLKAQAKRFFGNDHVWVEMHRADGNLRELSGEEAWEEIENFSQGQKELDNPPNIIFEQEVENLNSQSTSQVLPSIKEYTPPVTYPEEVEKTLGTPIEVEPLNETKLEEVGLNCNDNTPLSSREVPSFNGLEPQPVLNSPFLDMFNDDWRLESKEVSPLGEELNLLNRPNKVKRGRILEAHHLEPILQQ
ncbi:hypothetical protein Tco_0497238 [Tanacetum coccineum]